MGRAPIGPRYTAPTWPPVSTYPPTRTMLVEEMEFFGPGTFQQQLDSAYKDFVSFCRDRKLKHSQPPFRENKVLWLLSIIFVCCPFPNHQCCKNWLPSCFDFFPDVTLAGLQWRVPPVRGHHRDIYTIAIHILSDRYQVSENNIYRWIFAFNHLIYRIYAVIENKY